MICIYQINKWAFQWKMSFNQDLSKQAQNFLLVKKLRTFLILHYVLIRALFWKPISKTPWNISFCLINIWGKFETNYYQGKQSYRIQCHIQSYFEAGIPVWDPKLKPPKVLISPQTLKSVDFWCKLLSTLLVAEPRERCFELFRM